MKYLNFVYNVLLPSYYPPYLIFFATSKCNMRCLHCFYWQKLNAYRDELNLVEIERITKSMPNLFFLRITGGEPFLRKDLYQIISSFYNNSSIRRIGISTNGVLTDEIAKITEQAVNNLDNLWLEIGVSIDNLGDKHDEIRCHPGAFEKAITTYEKLSEIRERSANLHLGFIITMMKDNQQDLEKILQYLKSKNPDMIGLNIIRGTPKDISQLNIDSDTYDKFRRFLNEYNFGISLNRSFMEKMRMAKTVMSQNVIIDTLKGKNKEKCLAGNKIAVMYPDGDVAACELLDTNIGNIRKYNYDFKQLWNIAGRKDITQKIRKDRCCCTHECFITANLIFRPKNLFKILTKTIFTKRVI